MLPARRPRLMAQRIEARVSAAQAAEGQRAQELAARKAAEATERDRARKRRANTPFVRTLEILGGWIFSITGALIVSLLLTWLVRHTQALESLTRAAQSIQYAR